jgi:hypothetical protein
VWWEWVHRFDGLRGGKYLYLFECVLFAVSVSDALA